MREQQQAQLVSALTEMYYQLRKDCDESKAFALPLPGRMLDSAPVALDSHQHLLASDNAFKMPDTYDLFHFDWIECD